jgi:hypothetical protein
MTEDAKRAISKLAAGLGAIYLVASIVTSIGGLVAIGYYVFNSEWMPAIFVLLARKQLVEWFDRESKRVLTIPK